MNQPPAKKNGYIPPSQLSGSDMWCTPTADSNLNFNSEANPMTNFSNQPFYSEQTRVNQAPPPGARPIYAGSSLNTQDDPKKHSDKKPKGRKPGIWLIILVAVVLVVTVIFFGVRALRDQQIRKSIAPYQDVYAPNIFINDIAISGLKPTEALDQLQQSLQHRIDSWNLAVSYKEHVFVNLNYGSLGLSISMNELYEHLNKAWALTHTGTIYEQQQAIVQLSVAPYQSYTTQSALNGTQLQLLLSQISPFVNTDPVDAVLLRFQPDEAQPFAFQNEQPGIRLNIEANLERILALATSSVSGVYELEPEFIQPAVTRADLEKTVALRTSINTPISTTSTENRNHNIRLSFSKFNGKILNPGQSFSFNDVVGPRTYKEGFAEALEYVYGDLVTGVGGGVCQASTTLYQAVLTSGLTVTKRLPHSDPIDYTQMGQDATVYLTKDREIDLQFKNTTPGKIYLAAHVKTARNSSKRLIAEIKIYGTSLGDGVSYRLQSDVVQTLAPPVEKKYIVDKTGLIVIYKDQEKLKSRGTDGHVIETYLEKLLYGSVIERKLISSDTYRAKAAEYWVGNTPRLP